MPTNTTPAADRRPARVWANALIDIFTAVGSSPPVNSRAAGITFEAVYNAWACLQPPEEARVSLDLPALQAIQDGQSPATRTTEAQVAAMSWAAYTVVSNLFASQTTIISNAIYDSANNLPALSGLPSITIRAQDLGNTIGRIILDYRINDGSNQLGNYADTTGFAASNVFDLVNDNYNIANYDGNDPLTTLKWLPLRQNAITQTALTPHWGRVRPMVMGHGSIHRANLSISLSENDYLEILGYSANLTDERKAISEHFARGSGTESPPGQWLGVTRNVSVIDNNSIDQDVKMFYAVGAALMDAGIAAWDTKYHYQSPRPITAIRNVFRTVGVNGWAGPGVAGSNTYPGETWISYGENTPNGQSPPFPEIVSGHSTFGAAAMGVVAALRGSDQYNYNVTFQANSIPHDPGFPVANVNLNYANLTALVQAAGLSRLYKGIHFGPGDREGRSLGRTIAIRVYDHVRALVRSY
jgi:hypothetical protein